MKNAAHRSFSTTNQVMSGEDSHLDLWFLRTCRQIYDAAKNICYSTNIFSFDSLRVFMMFGKTVSWVPQIRSLRLRIQCVNNGSEPASSEALKQILGELTSVK